MLKQEFRPMQALHILPQSLWVYMCIYHGDLEGLIVLGSSIPSGCQTTSAPPLTSTSQALGWACHRPRKDRWLLLAIFRWLLVLHVVILFDDIFWDRVPNCSSCFFFFLNYAAESSLEVLIFLPLLPKGWNDLLWLTFKWSNMSILSFYGFFLFF